MTYRPKAPAVLDAGMAHAEQLFVQLGADGLARNIAARLRDPAPRREILDVVARLLDPRPRDELALVVKRRRRGNASTKWTKRVKDIEIAKTVQEFEREYLRAGKSKNGSRSFAVAKAAEELRISKAAVREALRQILPLIPKDVGQFDE
jgi:hypothetical protein